MRSRFPLPTALLPALLLAAVTACTAPAERVRRTELHMGTEVNITVVASSRARADRAVRAAFREIARIDGLLSHYKDDSEVTRLNSEQVLADPSPDLRANIEKSVRYGALSGGAFDITVQPILDLYDHTFRELKRPPTDEEIARAREHVDYRKIRLEGNTLFLGEGQRITLGGIAKGYAVDRALEALHREGVRDALVDAGGDLRASGTNRGREWVAALRNPRDEADFIARLGFTDRAVVTSGDYERYYDPDRRFHHIVDPRTGTSATELISVTVIADNAFDADAVSTAAFVLGTEEGLRLVESLEGVEALLIDRERQIFRSSGWSDFER
jgi:FAD:protein FMN transferase